MQIRRFEITIGCATYSEALFITTFVITAKSVITSIWSAQKIADRVFFLYSNVILQENIRFVYLLESPRRDDSNKYTKRLMHKTKLFKSIRYSCFRQVHIKFLYNSKFDLTANSLVTSSVVITRALCITILDNLSGQCCSVNVLKLRSFIGTMCPYMYTPNQMYSE